MLSFSSFYFPYNVIKLLHVMPLFSCYYIITLGSRSPDLGRVPMYRNPQVAYKGFLFFALKFYFYIEGGSRQPTLLDCNGLL